MRARPTAFSNWALDPGRRVEGPLTLLDAHLPIGEDLPSAWLRWLLEELVAETDCYFILERHGDANYYVQFAADSSGGLLAEAVGNTFLDSDEQLDQAQQTALLRMGWRLPTCGWPIPQDTARFQSPNFYRRFRAPVRTRKAAEMAVRALRDVYGGADAFGLEFVFFRREPSGASRVELGGGATAVFCWAEDDTTDEELEALTEQMAAAMRGEDPSRLHRVVPERCPQCGSTELAQIAERLRMASVLNGVTERRVVLRDPGSPTVECRQCGARSGRLAPDEPDRS